MIWFSVEVCPWKADGLALCNFNGLGREMVVGISLRVVGRRQNSILSNYSCWIQWITAKSKLRLCTYPIQASNPGKYHCHQCGTKLQRCSCCFQSPPASHRQSSPLRQRVQVWCHQCMPYACQWLWQCHILFQRQSQWNESRWCCPQEPGFSGLGWGR